MLTGVRAEQEIFDRTGWSKIPDDGLHLNVLIFGFDSLSHNMWKRKLPKSYRYATEDLHGIALNGYNIVGDGTPQALIPILTGKTELGKLFRRCLGTVIHLDFDFSTSFCNGKPYLQLPSKCLSSFCTTVPPLP